MPVVQHPIIRRNWRPPLLPGRGVLTLFRAVTRSIGIAIMNMQVEAASPLCNPRLRIARGGVFRVRTYYLERLRLFACTRFLWTLCTDPPLLPPSDATFVAAA
jgi:hypothetical protein